MLVFAIAYVAGFVWLLHRTLPVADASDVEGGAQFEARHGGGNQSLHANGNAR